jgi:BASS family bile acid:Na+ symporter
MQFLVSALASGLATCLAAIGRRGTEGFALSIFCGLALPQFAAQARPLLPVTIFCFTVIVFMRADMRIIAGLLRRPARFLMSCLWLILFPVLLVLAVLGLVGRENIDPGLLLGLAILGAAPPIMSSPAVAILYGFEPSLIIACVLSITVASPVIAPLVVDFLAGHAVPLDSSVLMFRMLIFIGGGMAVAMLLRRLVGPARIAGRKAELDGFGVVMYFVFAIAAMDGVTAAALSNPKLVALFLACAFGLSALGLASGLLLLRHVTPPDRFMLGYGAAQRNMGLLVAALGAGVPPTTFLFFALAQFPIYLMPWLLKPLAARLRR